MIQGLYSILPKELVSDPEVQLFRGTARPETNLCQIVRVPFRAPAALEGTSLLDTEDEALKKAVEAIDRILWIGQKWSAVEGGLITRMAHGVLALSSQYNIDFSQLVIGELLPLTVFRYETRLTTEPIGEWIWEGTLLVEGDPK